MCRTTNVSPQLVVTGSLKKTTHKRNYKLKVLAAAKLEVQQLHMNLNSDHLKCGLLVSIWTINVLPAVWIQNDFSLEKCTLTLTDLMS